MSGTLCSNLTRALTLAVSLIGLATIAGTARAAFIQGSIVGCAAANAACPGGNTFNNDNASAMLDPGSDKTAVFTNGNPEFIPGLTATFLNAGGASFTTLTLDIVVPPIAPPGSVNWVFSNLDLMEPGQVFTGLILSNQGVNILTGPELLGVGTASASLTLETGISSSFSSLVLQFLTGPPSVPVPAPAPFVLLAGGLLLLLPGRRFRP